MTRTRVGLEKVEGRLIELTFDEVMKNEDMRSAPTPPPAPEFESQGKHYPE